MEKKRNIFQKIIDFFLMLLKAISSLFKKEKKDDTKELEAFEDNIQKNVINLRDSNNMPLPDTQSTKNFPDYLESTSDTTDNRDKTLKMYKEFVKDKDISIYQKTYLIFDEDRVKEIIDEILKEEYDIDVKRTTKVIEENVEKLKEKLLEDVEEKIEKEELDTEENLKEYLKEEIKKEVKEHPLDKVEQPKQYVVATTIPKKIQPKEEKLPKVTQDNIIKEIPKKIKPKVIEKAEDTRVTMVKTSKPALVKPKDRLFVAAGTTAVMATKVATDLLTPLKKNDLNIKGVTILPNKELDLPKAKEPTMKPLEKNQTKIELKPFAKETTNVELKPLEKETAKLNIKPLVKEEIPTPQVEEQKTELTIEKEIKEEKEQLHEKVETKIKEFEYVDDHKDEVKDNEIAQINKERLVKENEKIITELKVLDEEIENLKKEKEEEQKEETKEQQKEEVKEEPKKEEKKKEEPKKEENKEPEKAPDFALTDNIASTIENSKVEMKSDKEFEDKEYDQYESQINELLYDIELYKIKYDKVLSKDQKKKLKEEERKLRTAKSNIQYQKSIDIEEERKALEEEINLGEFEGLQLELKKKHIENKKDLHDELIDKVEDLEELTDDKVHYLEKKLIKKKLRKALVATQMGSILALPFIRNKYFFYFTAGLIAKTELMFLGDLFKRKTSEYEPIELTALKNGRDALNGALNVTRDNILYLDSLEKTALAKYPELSSDSEYIQYIISLRNSLAKTQNKLARKRDHIDKFISKTTTKAKKLEQKLDNAA